MAEVIPGILEKDWSALEGKVRQAAAASGWVHIDLADQTMVDVATPMDFAKYAELIVACPGVSFEAHLLTASPEKYVKPLADSGFKRIIAHVESNDPRRFLDAAKYEEVEVGMALDGPSEVVEIEPFLEEVDFVLIAAIEEGSSGQKFMPEVLEKIKLIRQNFADLPIEVVGGINEDTAKLVIEAGATRIVSTSYVFKHPDGVKAAIDALQD